MAGELEDNQISSTLDWKAIASRPLEKVSSVFLGVQAREGWLSLFLIQYIKYAKW